MQNADLTVKSKMREEYLGLKKKKKVRKNMPEDCVWAILGLQLTQHI